MAEVLSKRARLMEILGESMADLKESIGHEAFMIRIAETTNKILEMGKPKTEMIHVIGPNGQHRLIVDGKSTDWIAPNELCRNGDYIAATDFFRDQLPQIGKVIEVDRAHYKTMTSQDLKIIPLRFSDVEAAS